ncbi:MAG TPA: L,D-transpeptidase [Candidatus Methanoperedens sp.]|nr:L,D-transpeptidase [Candidatus Methanoperedens sp.]
MTDPLRTVRREALRRAPWGLLLFLLAGCTRSEPFEARLAELQERKLWRSGVEAFAADEYRGYLSQLRRAKDALIETESRFVWFRDYDALTEQFKRVLAEGDRIHVAIGERREQQRDGIAERLAAQRDKIERLDILTSLISVGKASREFLAQAELLTDEAEDLAGKGRYREAEARLVRATTHAQLAKEVITPALKRFADGEQIAHWRRKVDETIRESKVRGGYAIVVSKVDRQLYLYRAGRLVRTFPVGLGSRSVSDKLCAGDRATPEGKYRITKKLAQSRYYKALLINYPNDEDRRQFDLAKRRGVIPRRAGIGGLIEIHGGGKDSQTYGCVSLDNSQMEEIYALADVDTPVTIVGARDYENSISQAMKGL